MPANQRKKRTCGERYVLTSVTATVKTPAGVFAVKAVSNTANRRPCFVLKMFPRHVCIVSLVSTRWMIARSSK